MPSDSKIKNLDSVQGAHQNINFDVKEIQLAFGQKDLEILLLNQTIRGLREEIKKLQGTLADIKP